MARITFSDVTKTYPNGKEAVTSLSLDIEDGESMVLVGPSGCGKTTALNMVAGLESISAGTLEIGDQVVNNVAAKDRDIAMVFQNYALYPHLNVYDNLAFSLKLRKTPKEEIAKRVNAAAETLGLQSMLHSKPRLLSGGQRQRVAMGRAIVREPKAFLMDEPLSNLDAKLRMYMRAEISRLQRALNVTMVYVTHDQIEAMTIGDRAAVMRDGRLQQVDTPHRLYDYPTNLFVAGFIGSPAMNIFEARLSLGQDGGVLHFGGEGGSFSVPPAVLEAHPNLRDYDGRLIAVGMRPEDIEDVEFASNIYEDDVISMNVELREELGAKALLHFRFPGRRVLIEGTDDNEANGSNTAEIGTTNGGTIFVAEIDRRSCAKEGESVRMVFNPHRFYFFDLGTEATIPREGGCF